MEAAVVALAAGIVVLRHRRAAAGVGGGATDGCCGPLSKNLAAPAAATASIKHGHGSKLASVATTTASPPSSSPLSSSSSAAAATDLARKAAVLTRRKPTRHKLLPGGAGGIDPAWLEALFPTLEACFRPQQGVKYKGVNWKISCYMELEEAFISGGYQVEPCLPLLEACRPLLDRCDNLFGEWYRHCYGRRKAVPVRQHSFLTRYLPMKDQDQLRKHIDGKHLDGSVVVRLPSNCVGGSLKCWDGKPTQEFDYEMGTGDVVLLDRAVWHQAMPVTAGIKWALVIFYKVDKRGTGPDDPRNAGVYRGGKRRGMAA